MKRLAQLIIGGRIKCTAHDDVQRAHRFEVRIEGVYPPQQKPYDPPGMIVVRLAGKGIPDWYRPHHRHRLYFDPATTRWLICAEDGSEITLVPELVGAYWLIFREKLEAFGFVVQGEDIRRISFRALYDNRKDLLQPPLTLTGEVNKKGDVLCAYAKELWEEHADWFTPEERDLINEYLGTR